MLWLGIEKGSESSLENVTLINNAIKTSSGH